MTADEVKSLQIGETVTVCQKDREPVICTVAFRRDPKRKFLTYRVNGEIRSFAIKDYPNMRYERPIITRERRKQNETY